MSLEDATAVFTNLAEHFSDQEIVLRSSSAGSPPDTYAVEIRSKPSKLSELPAFIEQVLSSRDGQERDLEGEFRVECEHEVASDGALWLVVTTGLTAFGCAGYRRFARPERSRRSRASLTDI
jgi:hypothetical protein